MEAELTTLLKENGCFDDVIVELTKLGCTKMNLMAHWFGDPNEVSTYLQTIEKAKRQSSAEGCIEIRIRKIARVIQDIAEEARPGIE